MEFISFLLLQFLAHILADYFFQWSAMAKQKAEKNSPAKKYGKSPAKKKGCSKKY